jgi:hypothetical protein
MRSIFVSSLAARSDRSWDRGEVFVSRTLSKIDRLLRMLRFPANATFQIPYCLAVLTGETLEHSVSRNAVTGVTVQAERPELVPWQRVSSHPFINLGDGPPGKDPSAWLTANLSARHSMSLSRPIQSSKTASASERMTVSSPSSQWKDRPWRATAIHSLAASSFMRA